MPHIDARSGEVVIRIVYDGAPEAGKTTNVQQLGVQISLQRRGMAKSPGTTGDRTEFFDWLDFSGGYLDGRRVRCQLVSVPGQPRLLHRRQYLLEKADAIVFVADSRQDTFQDAIRNLSTTANMVERMARGAPIGVIVQANKQDLPGALAPGEVVKALGAKPSTQVVGSVASAGTGVMETFILAVRLATDRVRTLVLGSSSTDLSLSDETPDTLHRAMVEYEITNPSPREDERIEAERREAERLEAERLEAERLEAARIEAERREAERREAERREAERREAERREAERLEAARVEAERLEAERREAERLEAARIEAARIEAERLEAERAAAATPRVTRGYEELRTDRAPTQPPARITRRNLLADPSDVALPRAQELFSGHVWPPVKGRAAFAEAAHRLTAPKNVRPWAPMGALELVSADGWLLHSTERWLFDDEGTARLRLHTLVRSLLPLGDLIPDGRALALAKDGGRWRLWLVTPDLPTLEEVARERLVVDSEAQASQFLRRTFASLERLSERGVSGHALAGGAAAVGEQEGRMVLLSWTDDEEKWRVETRDAIQELADLRDRFGTFTTARELGGHGS